MPKGPQGQKRSADTIANAVRVAKILTDEVEEDTSESGKDQNAQALGRKGGVARREKLTPERRREIAKKGRKTLAKVLIRFWQTRVAHHQKVK